MDGYAGWLLRVNLSERRIIKEELNRELARQYIGGNALGIRMFYDEVAPETDALSPDNKLYLLTGPVTGTPFPRTITRHRAGRQTAGPAGIPLML